MIERVNIAGLVALAAHPMLRTRLWGVPVDAALRLLADEDRFTILQDGERIAVFEHHWLGQYTALVLDIDDADNDFMWASLEYFFANTEAKGVRLSSANKDAGHCLGAYTAGLALSAVAPCPWQWQLDRKDFVKAAKERTDVATLPGATEAGADGGPDYRDGSASAIADRDGPAAAVTGRRKQRAERAERRL